MTRQDYLKNKGVNIKWESLSKESQREYSEEIFQINLTEIIKNGSDNKSQLEIISEGLTEKESKNNKDRTDGYPGMTGLKLNFRNLAGTITSFLTNANTAVRTYLYKDRDGTIADDQDVAGALQAAKDYADSVAGGESDASDTVKGISKLSVAPAGEPIAVGDNDTRMTDARTPTSHASTHTDGTDDIQDATAAQKGLLTSADWSTFNSKQGALGYTPENAANKDASGGYVGLDTWKIKFRNAANTFTSFLVNAATAARTYTFPDKNITVAGLDDITGTNSGTNTGDQILGTENLGLSASVGSSALTIALKQKDGSTDPSTGTAAVKVNFRSSTITSGAVIQHSATGALSLVISSGSTLGHDSARAEIIYVYLIDNSGTLELAVASDLWDDGTLVTTTAEGGAGAADSSALIYSATARSNVPVKLIGRLISTQATAGTWATAMSEVSVIPVPMIYTSEIRYDTGAATPHGTTNTKARRIETPRRNYGKDITYASSAAAGTSLTFNSIGDYTVGYSDSTSAAICFIGLSLNSAQLTTDVFSITAANLIAYSEQAAARIAFCSVTMKFNPADFVVPHTNGAPNAATASQTKLYAKRIS